jgi:ATP-dependent DNA helicase RecG
VIADVFKNMKWIEKVSTGYKRILDYFKAENLKLPKFETQTGGALITVFAAFEVEGNENIIENFTEKDTNEDTNKDTENLKRIFELIKNKPVISFDELAAEVGISRRAIINNTNKLKSLGILERIGADKGGHWKIIDKTAQNGTY